MVDYEVFCNNIGKTRLMDMLIETTHKKPWDLKKEVRYTDNTISEQERKISIFSTPISLILGDLQDKSYLINFLDTPGHISLTGEVTASIPLSSSSSSLRSSCMWWLLSLYRCYWRCYASNRTMYSTCCFSRNSSYSCFYKNGSSDYWIETPSCWCIL